VPTNIAQFEVEFKAESGTLAEDQSLLLQRGVLLSFVRRVATRTPVKTGLAAGNWQSTTDSPAETVIERFGAAAAIEEAENVAAGLKPFQDAYVSDPVDYMQYLNQGSSDQAPAGFVELSLAEVEDEFGP